MQLGRAIVQGLQALRDTINRETHTWKHVKYFALGLCIRLSCFVFIGLPLPRTFLLLRTVEETFG